MLEGHAELGRRHLGERGLVALTVRHLRREHREGAVVLETGPRLLRAEGTAAGVGLARPRRRLDVGGHAHSQVPALAARLGLPRPEAGDIDELVHALERLP